MVAAALPANFTVFAAAFALKFIPVINTLLP
jgi:hypothetical protein